MMSYDDLMMTMMTVLIKLNVNDDDDHEQIDRK